MVLTMYVAAILLLAGVLGFITKQREPLFIIVCLAAMLSPNVLWYHHFVFFVLPLLVWMAWSNFRARVVLWCCGGFVLVQAAGSWTVCALYVHAFGHASILLLVLWQVYEVLGRFGMGKAAVRNTLAGAIILGFFLGPAISGCWKPGFRTVERGLMALATQDLDLAIAEFTEAIRLDPNYAIAYDRRALAYELKKDYDKTIGDCTKAIQIDPNDAVAYYIRGDAYRQKRDFDKAIADYTDAIRLDPSSPGEFHSHNCVAPRRILAAVLPTPPGASWTRPLPITPNSSGFARRTPRRMACGALRTERRVSSIRRLRTLLGPRSLTRRTPRRFLPRRTLRRICAGRRLPREGRV